MSGSSVKVVGLRQLERTIAESKVELDLFMREGLLAVAEPTAQGVRSVYSGYSAVGAAGVKAKVTRPGNAIVVQTLRKSRSLKKRRRNFGGLMMRHAFLPSLAAHEAQIVESFQKLLDVISEKWRA